MKSGCELVPGVSVSLYLVFYYCHHSEGVKSLFLVHRKFLVEKSIFVEAVFLGNSLKHINKMIELSMYVFHNLVL